MIEDCVIVGGGVAGLSAANQLADSGMRPLIIEAGRYPAHRICGEFISHECLPILNRWNIPLAGQINRSRFIKGDKQIEFQLPVASASRSRFEFDELLLERAKKNGARIFTDTKVISLQNPSISSGAYQLQLSNGTTIESQHLIVGSGKIPNLSHLFQDPGNKYVGFKGHFEGIDIDKCVEMHIFDHGYLGIANVDNKTTNIASLVDLSAVNLQNNHDIDAFLSKLIHTKSMFRLKNRLSKSRKIFPQWLTGRIPEFGIRKNPKWDRVFWIGDAAGSIPPVSGDGLAIAVTSGCMAAEYLMNHDAHAFRKAWLKRYKSRFFWAQQLHRMIMAPWTINLAAPLCQAFPSVPLLFWKLTREQ